MSDKKLEIVNLRMYRMILGITCDEAANESDMTVGYYSRIENGHITWVKNHKKRAKLMSFYRKISRKAKSKMFIGV